MLPNVKNFTMPKGLTTKVISKVVHSFPIANFVFKGVYILELLLGTSNISCFFIQAI